MMYTMIQVNVHDAKTRLSALLVEVEKGEEIVIARSGIPVAKLIPYTEEKKVLGVAEGLITYMSADFDEPLPGFEDYM